MTPQAFEHEWQVLTRLLPERWRELARECDAIRAEKGITDPDVILRLLLMHTGSGLSLRSTVVRAREQELADLSHVALSKRLRNAGAWLAALGRGIFASTREARRLKIRTERRVRAVDATTVEERGAFAASWRVHYSVTVPEMTCDFYAVTSPKAGETFDRYPVDAGDLILGDRGYCHRRAVAQVRDRGGDVIVRLNHTSFPLLRPDGTRFDILENLRTLRSLRPHAWPVRFRANGRRYRARLCAIRKTDVAAEQAKAKHRKQCAKRGKAVVARTLEAAEYIFMLTTVRRSELRAREILELYRARWQIELVFKRLKSLLRLGEIPTETGASSRAWLQGKLLTALLTERLAETAGLFSPWGHDEASPE